MKGKFSSMSRVAIALVMVLSLGLVMAAPVAATVSEPAVTFTTANAKVGVAGDYSIVFTTTEALVAGDTITVVFPDGTDLTGYTASHVTVSPGGAPTSSAAQGQRVNIVLSDAATVAGSVTVDFTTTAAILNPETVGSYQLQVYTSKEPTAVSSAEYDINAAATTQLGLVDVIAIVSATAGDTTDYTISVQAGGTDAVLAGGSTLTFEFPAGTDVSGITGATFDGATATPSVSEQEVTVPLPAGKFLDSSTPKSVVISGVVNPTEALPSTYLVKGKSNIETVWEDSASTYAITAGDISKLGFTASPSVIAPDEDPRQKFTVESQDQYGNLVSDVSWVLLSTTSSTGKFWDSNTGGSEIVSATGIELAAGDIDFYYEDTTAGDYTITVTEKVPSEPTPWTDATTPLSVKAELEVGLYHDGALVAYYHTIQGAINAAVPGDTIQVGPGTYAETLTVNVADLIIESTGEAASTIIDGESEDDIVEVLAATVKIDGFTIKGDATTTQTGIVVSRDGFTIQNNKFIDITANNIFVVADVSAITSGTITNNTITGLGSDSQAQAIWVQGGSQGISGVEITDNIISDFDGEHAAIKVSKDAGGAVSDITITGNTITDSAKGIDIIGDVTGMTGTKAIANNTISGCTGSGVTVGGGDPVFDLVRNIITGNLYGIELGSSDGTFTIKYNDITGNTNWGLFHYSDGISVNATHNWWGDATGPAGTGAVWPAFASTAVGSGDAVCKGVTFSPWLSKSQSECVIASYPALTVDLSVGWNTLSAPAKLIATADAIDELVTSGVSLAYSYDGAWVPVTNGYVLDPCDAVYIKMNSAQTVLFQVDGAATWVPSEDLEAGWNLIGLANLVDMLADEAVASVSGSYAQVVSPSMNSLDWIVVADQEVVDDEMLIGEGYWIFMKSEATLGGFTLCPIAPQY